MSDTKSQKDERVELDEVQAETTPDQSVSTRRQETMDRLGIGEWSQIPAWFGRHWPDRFLGEMNDMLDHLRVEEFVKDGDLIVRAEMPGIDPENDVDISVDHGRLSIKARRESHSERTADDTYRSEFRYGSFSRMITLPEAAEVDEIKASYVDGILQVIVPLDEDGDVTAKSIKVTRA